MNASILQRRESIYRDKQRIWSSSIGWLSVWILCQWSYGSVSTSLALFLPNLQLTNTLKILLLYIKSRQYVQKTMYQEYHRKYVPRNHQRMSLDLIRRFRHSIGILLIMFSTATASKTTPAMSSSSSVSYSRCLSFRNLSLTDTYQTGLLLYSAANIYRLKKLSLPPNFIRNMRNKNMMKELRSSRYKTSCSLDVTRYRGGSDRGNDEIINDDIPNQYYQQPSHDTWNNQDGYIRQQQSNVIESDEGYYWNQNQEPSIPASHDDDQTVQGQIERWKQIQQQKYDAMMQQQQPQQQQQEGFSQQQTSNSKSSMAVDANGNLSLIASVSKGSRAIIFFVLMWRIIHLYEVADLLYQGKGLLRLMVVIPLCILFIANLLGAIVSMIEPAIPTSPSSSSATKKRLKAILNLNKFIEMILIFYYFLRLTLIPSKSTRREILIASMLHSVFFMFQSQFYTKLSWNTIRQDEANQYYP